MVAKLNAETVVAPPAEVASRLALKSSGLDGIAPPAIDARTASEALKSAAQGRTIKCSPAVDVGAERDIIAAQTQTLCAGLGNSAVKAVTDALNTSGLNLSQQRAALDVLICAKADASVDEAKALIADFVKAAGQNIDNLPMLLSQDRAGQTMLQNLHAFVESDRDLMESGLKEHKAKIIRELLHRTSEGADSTYQGRRTVTCGLANAEDLAVTHCPAEFCRTVIGLCHGQATLAAHGPDGQKCELVVKPAEVALESNGQGTKGRSLVSTLYQESMMKTLGGDRTGIYQNQVETLCESLGQATLRLDAQNSEERATLTQRALEAAADPKAIHMVSMNWQDEKESFRHLLRVVGEKDGQIILYDPRQEDMTALKGANFKVLDAKRGLCSISINDFKQNVYYAMVPAKAGEQGFGLTPGGDDPVPSRISPELFSGPGLVFMLELLNSTAPKKTPRSQADDMVQANPAQAQARAA